MSSRPKVAAAMSGGVDSSVAAALLKDQGYQVIGVTMHLGFSGSWKAADDARSVADKLGIPHHVVDLREEFQAVVDRFCQDYLEGRTPNPCIVCNRAIKFGALLETANLLGASRLATGHYARVEEDGVKQRYLLKKGVDSSKDQSYVLYGLTQEQLGRVIFPLGSMNKLNARSIAQDFELPVADKEESQEICFIEGDYGAFLMCRFPGRVKPGPILDMQGKRLGTHKGTPLYTVGQRRGLGMSADRALYVVEVKGDTNTLVVGPVESLEAKGLLATEVNFISFDKLKDPMEVMAKIRYRAKEVPATIYPQDHQVKVVFRHGQRAVTPGQSVVFYQEDVVIGGGVIQKPLK